MSSKKKTNTKSAGRHGQEEPANNIRSIRETIEALVIALVLAFFFKAFAAEAFVIPTGSMATTLMGRHKDVCCQMCNYPFQISASEEAGDSMGRRESGFQPKVMAGTCPQCRYTMYVGADNFEKKTFLSYNGDRIFVNKSLFDFRDPKRWHVTVFRYPGDAKINYIKRLVGLENETVRLQHGDVFVKKDGEEAFLIQRKPLRALLAMLRPIDDNDYVLPKLHELGWPTRWFDDHGQWKRSEDYKNFSIDSADPSGIVWLNYRHVIPSSDDWYYLIQEKMPPGGVVNNPQLITDFVDYNSGILRSPNQHSDSGQLILTPEIQRDGVIRKEHFCRKNPFGLGLNWVGDLALSCRLTVHRPEGQVLLRAIKGGTTFLCRIDLATGQASLSIPGTDGVTEYLQADTPADTPIRSGGSYEILFCNIDEEMRLVVDGKEIDFQGQGQYHLLCEPGGPIPRTRPPTALDLTPVGIASQGASVQVEHLKVQRDMYYIACSTSSSEYGGQSCDTTIFPYFFPPSENSIARVLSSPRDWEHFGKTNAVTFELGRDQFLMLGDNSAKSKDSRLWTSDGIPPHVDRELLIGEAVFVYWPHGLRIPGTNIALIPNFSKMRPID